MEQNELFKPHKLAHQEQVRNESLGSSNKESEIAKSFSDNEKKLLPCLAFRIRTIQLMFENPENFPTPFFDSDFTITKDVSLYELKRIIRCVKKLISNQSDIGGYEIMLFRSIANRADCDETNIDEFTGKAINALSRVEDIIGIDNSIYGELCLDSFKRQYEHFRKYTETIETVGDIYIIALAILTLIVEIEEQKTLELDTILRNKLAGIEAMFFMTVGNLKPAMSLIIELRRLFGASILTLLSITTSTGTPFDYVQDGCPSCVTLATAKRLVLKAIEQVKQIGNVPAIRLPNGITL
ncbi:hypothetical protein FACS1894219_04430 [Clostridia bacterium]|nr:hypothetical protein FACS1894219_04430 [Clostridia bacterium]